MNRCHHTIVSNAAFNLATKQKCLSTLLLAYEEDSGFFDGECIRGLSLMIESFAAENRAISWISENLTNPASETPEFNPAKNYMEDLFDLREIYLKENRRKIESARSQSRKKVEGTDQ